MAFDGERPSIFYAPERFALDARRDFEWLIDELVTDIERRFPEGRLSIIGFSLGSHIAVEVALRISERVEKIDLVSAAAPFELGNFLPHMAGRPVFEMARSRLGTLRLLMAIQGLAGKLNPHVLGNLLFHGSRGNEEQFVRSSTFFENASLLFARVYGTQRQGMIREIIAAIQPWANRVATLTIPIRLHHGSVDNWVPLAMAEALRDLWPQNSTLRVYPGCGHYLTLAQVLKDLREKDGY